MSKKHRTLKGKVYNVDGSVTDQEFETFQDVQKAVEGYVEMITYMGKPLYINEEGLITGKLANPHFPGRILVGNVVHLDGDLDELAYEQR